MCKELNSMYLNCKDYTTIKDILSVVLSKKVDICMIVPQDIEMNNAIAGIITYLEDNPDQPSVTLCARSNNPAEVTSLEKRVEWILKDKSLKSLNMIDEVWHYEDAKDMFRQYSDKALRLFNSIKGTNQKIVANSHDLGIVESGTPIYLDFPSLVYLHGGKTARLQRERNSYFFELNGVKCIIPE